MDELGLSDKTTHVANELPQFVHPCYLSIRGGVGVGS